MRSNSMRLVLLNMLLVITFIPATSLLAVVCGDVNADGKLNLLDISYIINYLYRGGPDPDCGVGYSGVCGDVNATGTVNLLDVSYDINYLYRNGPAPNCGTVTDIDGNVYGTVTIGTQVWMAENLKVTHYRNGDPIPNVVGSMEWSGLVTGAYCEYNNDGNNVATYGRLYNWYAAIDSRNIAPSGWHLPSAAEWQALVDYFGGDAVAGGKMKEAGISHWQSPNTGATNESGFSVLPGGLRFYDGGFRNIGYNAYFWSTTEYTDDHSWYRHLFYDNSEIHCPGLGKIAGLSLRCVMDSTITDIDGNVYQTVRIGTQVWMAENLKVTHYRNGDPIPNVTDATTWENLTSDAYCNYNNDINNIATYGRLYDWYAVADSRNIAPVGWHVPTDAEWKQLEMYLGLSQAEADVAGWRGDTEGGKLKESGTIHWVVPNAGATNESGFSAVPGGYRYHLVVPNESYRDLDTSASFWSSTEYADDIAWGRFLMYNTPGIQRSIHYKNHGATIRCVKD